jgi:hypothetical protein
MRRSFGFSPSARLARRDVAKLRFFAEVRLACARHGVDAANAFLVDFS